MFRLRPSPSLALSLIALFVALGGTGYAAFKLPSNSIGSAHVINGSLQKIDLSKKTVAALRGNRGPRGVQGVQGESGPTGPVGPKGDKGATGEPWTAGSGLPSGRTLRGVFAPGGTATGAGSIAQEGVSFGFVLAQFPTVHVVGFEDPSPPPECPGVVWSPAAQAGHLCLYTAEDVNVSGMCVFNPAHVNDPDCLTTSLRGFGLAIESAAAGDFWLQGSWAVTAG
jgi:hypothetical protein